MEQEKWVPIKDYEGYYSISNYGRMRTHERLTKRNGRINEGAKALERSHRGYMKVSLYRDGAVSKFWVHRLVATHFIPNPENKKEVNHIDFNPSNNHVDNLEWVTPSENMKHLFRSGRSSILGIAEKSREATRKPVIKISINGGHIAEYRSVADAARSNNARPSDICACLKGRQKSCVGYKWKYA